MIVTPEAHQFGACVRDVDLSQPLPKELVQELRRLWLNHQVLYFPEQPLTHQQLERFTLSFGAFGNDPYVAPVREHPHILEVRREAQEKASPFGSSWHSDWSFQQTPPSATILHAKETPPYGGDTLYADGYRAWEALDEGERNHLASLKAIHSARRPYSHKGFLAGGGTQRSMRILPSDKALETQIHPLVRTHPETGRKALWVNRVYTIGIEGLDEPQANALLEKLCAHATQAEFIYRHHWEPNMLVMWDNRCVQHCAQGGYDGHRRVMHRTTVAGDVPV